MTLNAQAQTLTAHTNVLASVPFDVSGDPTNQTPPTPQMASMSGNSGQLSYTYPLSLPAGPDGFGPALQMSYSGGSPNQRYGNVTDDRLDPFYCPNNANNPDTTKRCTGVYAHPEEKAWTSQVVTKIQALGTDSSDPTVPAPATTYNYSLATTGSDPSCNPITGTGVPPQEGQCVRDTWIPGYNSNHVSQPDGDWQDYYHSEYRGFNIVYVTSMAGDVTADYYFSTEAWYTPQTDGPNYSAGSLYQEDAYWGNQLIDGQILRRTTNQYLGTQGSTVNACNTALNATYTPCEVVLTSSKTLYAEDAGTDNANAPWVEHDYTYDDINAQGLVTTPPDYHNVLQEVISSKDAPTITKKWTYLVNDQTAGGVTYYHVNAVSHSEIDDDIGHVWNCQDVTYDEGRASGVPAPAAGWVTTTTAHSNCSQQSATALNTYTGYDIYGNTVATVDPLAAANPTLYNGASGQRFGQQGTSFYWGFNAGSDTPTGEMHSQTVTLGGNGQVDFLIGGGNDSNNLYVALVRASDNSILFKATGQNSEVLQRVTWNASADIGTQVYLKVVDNSSGGWGHINLDDVHIAGASLPNADFEQGNLSGWIVVSGTAFQDANVVSKVTANNGCGLSTSPAYIPSTWSGTRWYETCTTYDSFGARATSTTNALAQTSTTTYDYTQGGLPISAVDLNGQTTTIGYSYDSNGNRTVQASQPLETGSFTKQSTTNSTCTSSSTLPCYEVDTVSSQYPGAITRTFYDNQGSVAETRTPFDSTHDLITFTVHDEVERDQFQSLPFRVARGPTWIDPSTATDDTGATPGGTTTAFDPLGRVAATQDPLVGSSVEPGISCLGLTVTTCHDYGFDQVAGTDTNWYHWSSVEDANSHMVVNFDDTLGRTRYEQWYSSDASPSSNVTAQKQSQYNALDKPTSVTMTDLTPQTGQTITSVTATAAYDDLGRMTSSTDPDRGTHTFTYDADGHLLTDVSGTHTLGTSYDLLGRAGCVQDATPTTNGYGNCSTTAHALVQNVYDISTLGASGSDFPVGQLTRSVATTYYPDGSAATATQLSQHDQRGRMVSSTLQLGVPGSWNVTTALPTYQENLTYNDDDQLMTTQTTVGGQAGYTFSQAYDSTTGLLTGLSNNTTGTANLATLGYDAQGDVSDVNFQTTTGTALANDHFTYDGDLRPVTASATWQSGSGSTGTIFSQGRSYDAVGNVTSLSTTLAAVPGQNGSGGSETQNFCYDEENRLVWAGNTGTQPAPGIGTCGSGTLSSGVSGAGYNVSYAYTHLGQLWQGPLNGTGNYQYLYCNSTTPHQLTGLYPIGTTCSNLSGAVYTSSNDNWGNVTSRTYNTVGATLSYDLLDNLVQWNAGANSQEWYAYTTGGNRTLRRSTTGSGTTITVYALPFRLPTPHSRLPSVRQAARKSFGLEEHVYSSNGTPQSSTSYYTLGGRLVGALTGSTTQFFLTDALGSVLTTFTAIANTAAVQGNQLYGPYGNSRYSQGSMGTNKGFTGHYADATGLDYYNARYYDPVIGRFLSADVVQSDLQGMDPYDYVGGNPETLTDPTGERYAQTIGGGDPVSDPGSGGGVRGGACKSYICYAPGGQAVPKPNAGPPVTPYSPPSHPAKPRPPAQPHHAGPSVSQVTAALKQVAGIAGQLLWEAIDLVFNFSGMWHDIQTITDPNAGWWDKFQAGVDLGATIFTDINMLDGEGEAARAAEVGAEIAEKGVADVADKGLTDAASDVADCALSFSPRTPVATDHGKQAIISLHPGDKVWAYNRQTGKMELQPILHVWINHDNDLVDLTITTAARPPLKASQQSEVVHTTQKHPFLTVEKGFLPVGQIKLGMHVLRADGSVGTITGWKVVPGSATMYNLEVAQDHTYTVGDGL